MRTRDDGAHGVTGLSTPQQEQRTPDRRQGQRLRTGAEPGCTRWRRHRPVARSPTRLPVPHDRRADRHARGESRQPRHATRRTGRTRARPRASRVRPSTRQRRALLPARSCVVQIPSGTSPDSGVRRTEISQCPHVSESVHHAPFGIGHSTHALINQLEQREAGPNTKHSSRRSSAHTDGSASSGFVVCLQKPHREQRSGSAALVPLRGRLH